VTLAELMVTLVIISVLAAIALPGLAKYSSRKALSHQADEICALFSRVRERAMVTGYSWRIAISPGQGRWACFGDANANGREDPGEERMGPYRLSSGISFGCLSPFGPNDTEVPLDGVSFVNNKVNFSPMGSCNAGTIFLRGEKNTGSMALRTLPASGTTRMYEYGKGWNVLR